MKPEGLSRHSTSGYVASRRLTLASVAVDGTIVVLKGLLLSIDLVLILSRPLFSLSSLFLGSIRRRPPKDQHALADKKDRAQVVVVGGSFAGLEAVKHLEDHADLDVVLITDRPYFEYTPGVLRCLVEPQHFYAIACPLPSLSTNVLIATATGHVHKATQSMQGCTAAKLGARKRMGVGARRQGRPPAAAACHPVAMTKKMGLT